MKNFILPLVLFFTFLNPSQAKEKIDLNLSKSDIALNYDVEVGESNCLNDYRKWRNNAAIASGLTPFVGLAGLTGSVMLGLGWEYGGWYALKEALGPVGTTIAGGAINFVIPTSVFVGTVVYETAMIARFIKASRSYRLIKNLYSNEDDKLLLKLTRKVQRKRPDITAEDIQLALLEADKNGKLCDGSMVSRFVIFRTKYNKRLATMKDMQKWLVKNL